MQQNVYIQGLNRQAKYFGLPLPLAMASFLPPFWAFIIFDSLWYLCAIPVLGAALWTANSINPHFAQFIAVVSTRTPERLLRGKTGSHYE